MRRNSTIDLWPIDVFVGGGKVLKRFTWPAFLIKIHAFAATSDMWKHSTFMSLENGHGNDMIFEEIPKQIPACLLAAFFPPRATDATGGNHFIGPREEDASSVSRFLVPLLISGKMLKVHPPAHCKQSARIRWCIQTAYSIDNLPISAAGSVSNADGGGRIREK